MTVLFKLLTVLHLVHFIEHAACEFDKVCHSYKNSTLFMIDCSHSNISTIPIFPLDVHVLNLKFNKIEIIKNGAFKMLQNLTELDLSFNQLVELERYAFVGLKRLQKLSLQNNTLRYSFFSFPDSVLTSLISLTYLNIKFNQKQAEDNLLKNDIFDLHVPTLRTLEIDVFLPVNSTDAGIFSTNSTHLKALITGICVITELQEATFDNFKYLEYIDLSSCPIETYRSNTLQNRYIKYLDLSNTQFLSDGVSFFAFMNDIKTCAVDILVLSNTVTGYDEVFDRFISTLFKYLFYTGIRELRLSYNRLNKLEWRTNEITSEMVKTNLSHTETEQYVYNHDIPSTLQILDLSHNSLVRFDYPMGNVVCLNLSHNILTEIEYDVYVNDEHHTNLKVLDLSYNRIKSLNYKTMDILSKLLENGDFSINLENNNFQCACDTINFVCWMQKNLLYFQNKDLYKCQLKNGSVVVLNDLNALITQLERQCLPLTTIIVCTSLGILITCIIILTKLVYRNSWIKLHLCDYYFKRNKEMKTSDSTELKEGLIYS